MSIEVIRVLVYTYPDEDEMRKDMGHWNMAAEGVKDIGGRGTMTGRIESMIVKQPPPGRTHRQQRVLDVANEMVRARNETARGVPTAAVIEPEGEETLSYPDAIEVAPADCHVDECVLEESHGSVHRFEVAPMAMPAVKDPYRPVTWLNPPPIPEWVLDIGDVFDDDGEVYGQEDDWHDETVAGGSEEPGPTTL